MKVRVHWKDKDGNQRCFQQAVNVSFEPKAGQEWLIPLPEGTHQANVESCRYEFAVDLCHVTVSTPEPVGKDKEKGDERTDQKGVESKQKPGSGTKGSKQSQRNRVPEV